MEPRWPAILERGWTRNSRVCIWAIRAGTARRILGEIDDLDQLLTQAKGRPSGLLRVNATLGFGRMHIAPAISEYVRAYPDVDVQLQLSADPPPLNEDLFDVCVRFG